MQTIRGTAALALAFAIGALTANASDKEPELGELKNRVVELERQVRGLQQALDLVLKAQSEPPRSPAPQPPAAAEQRGQYAERKGFNMPPELIPEIGKTGAQVGLLVSGSSNPFGLNH